MALLIDHTHAFDVEIVDDWLFLYTHYALPVTDPATWHRLAQIHDLVTQRVRDRSRTYRDHRVTPHASAVAAYPIARPAGSPTSIGGSAPPPIAVPMGPPLRPIVTPPGPPPPSIAAQGRRLRRGCQWSAVQTIAFVAFFILVGAIIFVFLTVSGFQIAR